MGSLKTKLVAELETIEGIEHRPSPVSGGSALFYRGRELAHFHHDNELDLRLTKNVIRSLGLSHPEGSVHHAKRSPNSPWIELRFYSQDDVTRVASLVRLAIDQL